MTLIQSASSPPTSTRWWRFTKRLTDMTAVRYTPDFARATDRLRDAGHWKHEYIIILRRKPGGKPLRTARPIVEFIVRDIDRNFEQLSDFVQPYLVQQPTTMAVLPLFS